MADFDPRQLDALEDALEDLEIEGDLGDLELAPELLARLAEYQQVLALTRDALPLDDPPEGLLDAVLAEAREAARNAPVPAPELRGDWRRTWDRWRASLVPFAALAGTAALVLWIAKPGANQELARVDSEVAKSEEVEFEAPANENKGEPGEPASGQSRDSAEAAGSLRDDEPSEADAPTELAAEAVESPVASKIATKRKQAGGAGAAPAPAIAVDPVTPLSKDDAWTDLERADAARRKGDCDRARKIYDKVIAASSQSTALAQAKAGVGLCFEQDGKSLKAASWFEDARQHSPGIDAWIRGQRDDQPLPGEKKKSSKAKDSFEDLDSL